MHVTSSSKQVMVPFSQNLRPRLSSSRPKVLLTIACSSSAGDSGSLASTSQLSHTRTMSQLFHETSLLFTRKGPYRLQRYQKPWTSCLICFSSFLVIYSLFGCAASSAKLPLGFYTRTARSVRSSLPVQQLATIMHLWTRGQRQKEQASRAVSASR